MSEIKAIRCDGEGCAVMLDWASVPYRNNWYHLNEIGWKHRLNRERGGWLHYCPACVAAGRHEEKAETEE